MPRTLQQVYSREDYCLFTVFSTGVLSSVAPVCYRCNMAQKKKTDYKKSVKPGVSSDDDVKYTKPWYDAKIAKYDAQLQKAKIDAPYMVKDLQEEIANLKYQRRYASIKLPPSNYGPRGVSRGDGLGIPGGGLRKHGR